VRLLAELRHPAWAPVFGLLGAMPLHAPASTTLVAARLLTAPCSASAPAVKLLPSQRTAAELTAATISEISEGPPHWALWNEGIASSLRSRAEDEVLPAPPPPPQLLALLRAEAAAAASLKLSAVRSC
jgi:hypothetical protein